MKYTWSATEPYAKVSEFITQKIPFLSLSVIKKQIRAGEVRVNGVKMDKDGPIIKDDEVRIFLPQAMEPKAPELEILYHDDNIAIAVKPVLCETETHMKPWIREKFPNAVPVHRLDRNTSGLVIFALNPASEKELCRFIEEKKIEKTYRALVSGVVTPAHRTVRVFLCKDADASVVKVSDQKLPGFLTADLEYQTVGKRGEDTVIDIRLITGRTHQIRATMAHLGHPIIGDGKYGKESHISQAKYQKLFAYKIRFMFAREESRLLPNLSGKEFIWNKYELF